jgi:hypothetical protein
MIANDSQRPIQNGMCDSRTSDNVACVRTDQRLAAEAAMRKPEVTKTKTQILGEAYGNAYLREQEAKAKAAQHEKLKADARAVAEGTLKYVNGMRLEQDHGQWFVTSN